MAKSDSGDYRRIKMMKIATPKNRIGYVRVVQLSDGEYRKQMRAFSRQISKSGKVSRKLLKTIASKRGSDFKSKSKGLSCR
jgi:hypothetical protein